MNDFIIRNGNKYEEKLIFENLVKYNLSQVPSTQEVEYIWINKVVEDENKEIIAGITGKMYCWKCVYIDQFWIKEEFRRKGLGSKLLNEVEKMAKENGCHLIHLDTFDFQGKDFYLKHGYEVFGVLEDCPPNHKRYYMKKNI